ncbi:MAG: hybrid sensor histidine kinase/response regulator [Verrucomicrobiales bacterium]|nr:hybrid sensor histidine kinase/response regulator [Verrucomicrobiales bacterium]
MRLFDFSSRSIKQKQILILMLTSSMALLLASSGFVVYELLSVKDDMVQRLSTMASYIGQGASAAFETDARDGAQKQLMSIVKEDPNIVRACIYGKNGSLLAVIPDTARDSFPKEPSPAGLFHKFTLHTLKVGKRVQPNLEDGSKQEIPIFLESNLNPIYERLSLSGGIVLAVFCFSFLASLLLASQLQRVISRPILQLLDTAKAITEKQNYSARAQKTSDDELGVLIDGFNAMLDQIQERDSALQKIQNELERRVEQRTEALKLEVADRRKAEMALRESDERFKLVARATNDAVWDWNLKTDSLWWNEGFQTLFGYRASDVEASIVSWTSRLHPEDADRVLAHRRQVIHSEDNFWSDEYRFRRANGSYAYIFDRGNVIRNDDLQPVRMLGAMVDITARKEAEKVQQQQLARISLLNQITRAISERQDLQSVMQTVLQQLERHLPVSFGAILLYESKTDLLTSAAARARDAVSGALKFLEPGTRFSPDRFGLRQCLKGQTLYVSGSAMNAPVLEQLAQAGLKSIAACPLLVEGNAFGVMVCARSNEEFSSGECEFLRMLSEQVALAAHQAQLYTQLQTAYNELRMERQSVIEQERLRALGKMASGIAHDINNALSPIVVYAEMLQRGAHPPDAVQRYLHSIRTAGEDIAHIVTRMREFYRKREADDVVFPIKLNHLTQEVIDLTRPRWRDIPQERGLVIDVETDFSAELPEILGNASELREAVTNLVLNAIDAMPDGGKIVLRTSARWWQDHSSVPKASQVWLEISDTGIGMDEETRSRCLEPFFTTKGTRGTGLGLAMVYGIAERHEAKIEIDSAVGKGTTIRMVFPVREITHTTTLIKKPDTAQPRSLRILCVDDEPLLRELLKELLELDGHKVETADGGESGINKFTEAERGERFDVVITDLGMPRVDGRQVARNIRDQSPLVPIILLTGWGNMMKADGEIPTQVDAVISKPPRVNELRDTLKRVMDKQAKQV